MVISTLCPAVHILCSQNVYSRAEGIDDHYWPWTVFFSLSSLLSICVFTRCLIYNCQLAHSQRLDLSPIVIQAGVTATRMHFRLHARPSVCLLVSLSTCQ